MAKRITGCISAVEGARPRRDEIKFDRISIATDKGQVELTGISAHPLVAQHLQPGACGVFYASTLWNVVYGVRPDGGEAVFKSDMAGILYVFFGFALLLTGAFTTIFVFGWFVALAGIAAIFASFDARNARAMLRRDIRQRSAVGAG